MEQPPSAAIRDAAAILRVRKCDEIESLRFRGRTVELDRSFDDAAMFHINDVVGKGRGKTEEDCGDETQSHTLRHDGCIHDVLLKEKI